MEKSSINSPLSKKHTNRDNIPASNPFGERLGTEKTEQLKEENLKLLQDKNEKLKEIEEQNKAIKEQIQKIKEEKDNIRAEYNKKILELAAAAPENMRDNLFQAAANIRMGETEDVFKKNPRVVFLDRIDEVANKLGDAAGDFRGVVERAVRMGRGLGPHFIKKTVFGILGAADPLNLFSQEGGLEKYINLVFKPLKSKDTNISEEKKELSEEKKEQIHKIAQALESTLYYVRAICWIEERLFEDEGVRDMLTYLCELVSNVRRFVPLKDSLRVDEIKALGIENLPTEHEFVAQIAQWNENDEIEYGEEEEI